MADLWKNKLFLSYLAAAGQDLQQEGQLGTNVNAVTQNTIATQNTADLLKRFLHGEVEGGKMSADEKGVKLDIPKGFLLKDIGGFDLSGVKSDSELSRMKIGQLTEPPITEVPVPSSSGGTRRPNPFSYGSVDLDLSGSELAGITPENLRATVAEGMAYRKAAQAALEGRSQAEIDNAYKLAQMEYTKALTDVAKRPAKVTDTRTGNQKEYAQAVEEGSFTGTFTEWVKKDPEQWQLYKLDKAENPSVGTFSEWRKNILSGGAPRISLGERLKVESQAQAPTFFQDPEWPSKVEKSVLTPEFKIEISGMEPAEAEQAKWVAVRNGIEKHIRGGGGNITEVWWDRTGRIAYWKVTWENDEETTVSYDTGRIQ